MNEAQALGERISFHRRRLGLSQVEFAGAVDRSESWVSQVERGARRIDRLSVLQAVADALGVPVAELRGYGEDEQEAPAERPESFEELRLILTGHPALSAVLDGEQPTHARTDLEELRRQHARVWELVHETGYAELAPLLTDLVPALERATRVSASQLERDEAGRLLTDTYQAAAAMLAKLSENDAAWVAADRAAFTAERIGDPLLVAASLFRMAHVFLSLRQLSQAHQAGDIASRALEPKISENAEPATLSLYGAVQLVLAVVAARDNDRSEAHARLDTARKVAGWIRENRNDFSTEFGPTNVALHSVGVAVELGDAGAALDLAGGVDASNLSTERQARFLVDVARAQTMRRQIGEALESLQQAETLAPEQTRSLKSARETATDLLQLAGNKARPELRELATRLGVL